MLGILLIGFMFAFNFLSFRYWMVYVEDAAYRNAINSSNEYGGVLYRYNIGIFALIWVFNSILWSVLIVAFLPMLSMHLLTNGFFFTVWERTRSSVVRWLVDRTISRLRTETDPVRYMRRTVLARTSTIAALAVVLSAATAWTAVRETRFYSIFTPTAYVSWPFFPWSSLSSREWSSAVSGDWVQSCRRRRQAKQSHHLQGRISGWRYGRCRICAPVRWVLARRGGDHRRNTPGIERNLLEVDLAIKRSVAPALHRFFQGTFLGTGLQAAAALAQTAGLSRVIVTPPAQNPSAETAPALAVPRPPRA